MPIKLTIEPSNCPRSAAGSWPAGCNVESFGVGRLFGWFSVAALLAACDASLVPPDGSPVLRAQAVAAGSQHSCALVAGGQVKCWGDNSGDQLGDGGGEALAETPVLVQNHGVVTAISAGSAHTCALLGDGGVECWGTGIDGQLGGGSEQPAPVPTAVALGQPAIAVGAGFMHSCAVLRDGTAACWGNNSAGQLGDGTTQISFVPVAVAGLTGAVAIAAGDWLTCALRADGTVQCWGEFVRAPDAPDGPTDAVALVVGAAHACALERTGAIVCWGDDNQGQLGDGRIGSSQSAVEALSAGAVGVAAADRYTCAIEAGGAVRCWGLTVNGQLGHLANVAVPSPTAVGDLSGALSVAAGSTHACAVVAGGVVRCWGINIYGELGDGQRYDEEPTPVTVMP